MMGRLNHDYWQLFYSFCLEEVVPDDHLVRSIAAVLDLSWVHAELAPHYADIGRPSIDPVLMIRMLIIGYVFAIRSERLLCREVKVNMAYRWFCGLSIEDKIPDHSAFSRARNERFREATFFAASLSVWSRPALRPALSVVKIRSGCEPDRGRCQQAAFNPGLEVEEGSRSSRGEPGREGVSRNPR